VWNCLPSDVTAASFVAAGVQEQAVSMVDKLSYSKDCAFGEE